jgi:hypothetical protein
MRGWARDDEPAQRRRGEHAPRGLGRQLDAELGERGSCPRAKRELPFAGPRANRVDLDEVIHERDAESPGEVVVAGGGQRHRSTGARGGSAETVEHREDLSQTRLGELVHREPATVAGPHQPGVSEPAEVVGELSGGYAEPLRQLARRRRCALELLEHGKSRVVGQIGQQLDSRIACRAHAFIVFNLSRCGEWFSPRRRPREVYAAPLGANGIA